MTITIKDDVRPSLANGGEPRPIAGKTNSDREALAMFADELSAHHYLERLLWPNGVYCPHCGCTKVGKLNGASTRLGTCKCYRCRKTFSVLHGTLMSGSHVPPHKWLQAMYLTDGGTKPMRAHHLCRILDVSFKTAQSMMRRLEAAAAGMHDSETVGTGAPLKNNRLSDTSHASPGLTLAG